MTAVLEAPAQPAVAPAPGPRRRRATALLLASVLALLGLGWTGLALWAPSTVDLAAGSTRVDGAPPVVTVPEYGDDGTTVVAYRHGQSVEITVPLRNDGPLPVRVTGVATGAGVFPLLEVRSVEGLPRTIGPGDTGEVVLRAVLGNCRYYNERQLQLVRSLVVDVDSVVPFAGSTREELPLAQPLLVKSPMIVGCPDRTLTREDDSRADVL